MINLNKNVIVNSEEKIFVFDISSRGNIMYKQLDCNMNLIESADLNDDIVYNYSATIDQNDIIHLIALINTGELYYYKYIDGQWHKNIIAMFNLKSNIYNQFETLIIKDKLHLIYNYSHLINSNIWTIQHVVYDNKREEQYNVVRYISKKEPEPFIVDVDSIGNIHLLYVNHINNYSQIYHSFYSLYGKMWNPHPELLSYDNINNFFPYLLIDSRNNIHCIWIEDLRYKFNLKMIRMSLSGRDKYKWNEIQLPSITVSNGYPILFEHNNILNLLFNSKDKIILLKSDNYGNTWIKSNEEHYIKDNTEIVKLKISPLNYPDKINTAFIVEGNDEKITFLHHFLNNKSLFEGESPEKTVINSENESEINYEAVNTCDDEEINSKIGNYLQYMFEINNKLEEILNNQNQISLNLEKLANNQSENMKKLDILENLIKNKNKSIWEKIFK